MVHIAVNSFSLFFTLRVCVLGVFGCVLWISFVHPSTFVLLVYLHACSCDVFSLVPELTNVAVMQSFFSELLETVFSEGEGNLTVCAVITWGTRQGTGPYCDVLAICRHTHVDFKPG